MGNGVSTDEVPIELADLQEISRYPKAIDRKSPSRCVRAWAFREGTSPTAVSLVSVNPAAIQADMSYLILSITKPQNITELEDSWKNWAQLVFSVMTPRGVMTPVSVLDRFVGGLQVSVWVWNGTKCPWNVRSEALITALHLDRQLKWEASVQGLLDIATAQVNSCEPLTSPRSPLRGSWIRGFRRLLGCVALQSSCFPNLLREVNVLSKVVPDAPTVVLPFEAPVENGTITPTCTPRRQEEPMVKPEVLRVIGLDSLDRTESATYNSSSAGRGIKRDNEALDESGHEVPKIPLNRGSFVLDLCPVSSPPQQERDFNLPEKRHRELELEQCRPVCSEIIPGKLFLASYVVASNLNTLLAHGITHIVNTAADVCESLFTNECMYLTYYLKDIKEEDISAIFYRTFDFIDHAIAAGGRVLVHCREGISRSGTVIVAYLMYKYRADYDTAFKKVKEIRWVCSPNTGFICQLLTLQKRLHVDARANGVSAGAKKTAYRVSIHDVRQPFLVLLEFGFARKVDVIPYDPRFGFVLRLGSTMMGWIGDRCINHEDVRAAIEEYARWVEKYEEVQIDVKVFAQGDETSQFWEWNDVEQPGPAGFVCMRPEFDQDMRDLQAAYGVGSTPPCSPRTPVDDEPMEPGTPVDEPMAPRTFPAMPSLAFPAREPPPFSSMPHRTSPAMGHSASPATEHLGSMEHSASPVTEPRACRAIPPLVLPPKILPASSAVEPQVLLFDTQKMNSPCHRRVEEDLDENKSFLLIALGATKRAFLWIGKCSSEDLAHDAAATFLKERYKELLKLSVVQQGSESTDFWRYFKAE
eukprot:GEMP01003591.1.p1 GENE.GEMP01003591.1~~GEMP01003591.1.p1  ORF type:complete len:812 (+),score=169.03 GEMP01003591.1:159-2594(+)